MIAGGAEAVITPLGRGRLLRHARACRTRNDEPEKASRPCDARPRRLRDRRGARHRGARGAWSTAAARAAPTIYAEVVGYGMSADAYHITAPASGRRGRGARDAGRHARRRDRPRADRLHQRPRHLDAARRPLRGRWRSRPSSATTPTSWRSRSTKSCTGHLLGAAGGLETGILALAMRHQILPPTINLDHPGEGCDLDFVPKVARPVDSSTPPATPSASAAPTPRSS